MDQSQNISRLLGIGGHHGHCRASVSCSRPSAASPARAWASSPPDAASDSRLDARSSAADAASSAPASVNAVALAARAAAVDPMAARASWPASVPLVEISVRSAERFDELGTELRLGLLEVLDSLAERARSGIGAAGGAGRGLGRCAVFVVGGAAEGRDQDDDGSNEGCSETAGHDVVRSHCLPPLPPASGRPPPPRAAGDAARLLVQVGLVQGGFVLELGDLDRDLERRGDRDRRGRDAGSADDRCDRGEDAADLLGVDARLAPAARRLSRYEAGGASTATSAAMRTSISASGSRLEASTESAVMLASRSRTGVSVVGSAMVLSFRSTFVPERGWVAELATSRARSRLGARSCRRRAGAGCRAEESSHQPLPGTVWSQLDSFPPGAVGPK